MSEITYDITLSPITATYVVDNSPITFTPEVIDLNVYTNGGLGTPNSLNANIANVRIYGGTNGQYLQTDGTGNLTWATGGGSGNGVVGGTTTQVQFNDSGNFGGNVGFTFDKTVGNLNVPTSVNSNSANIGNVIINGNGITTPGYYGDITGGNLFSAYTMNASIQMNTPNLVANIVTANYVTGVTDMYISGNLNISGNLTSNTGNITANGNVIASGVVTGTQGVGYVSGSGGTTTQVGNRSSAVSLNKLSGRITLVSSTVGALSSQQFTFNNSFIQSTDTIIIQQVSGTFGYYNFYVVPGSGSATIYIANMRTSTSPNEAPVLQFLVLKGTTS